MTVQDYDAISAARAAWRKHWRETGFHPGRTIGQEITHAVAKWPETKLVFGSRDHPAETTIAAAWADSRRVAAGLHALGLRAGDAIVSQVPNWLEGHLLYLAAVRLGLVYVPVIHIFGPRELGFILHKSKAKALVLPDRWRSFEFARNLPPSDEVPDLKHVIAVGDSPMPEGCIAWSDVMAGNHADVPDHSGTADAICLYNFTSGTTSEPKGVMHSHDTLAAEMRSNPVYQGQGRCPGGSLQMTPGGHITSVINFLWPYFFGADKIYMDHFEPGLAVDLIQEHRPMVLGGVPVMIAAAFDALGEGKTGGVRNIMTGAAGVPASLIERGQRLGIPITKCYGLTEHPTLSASSPDDPLAKRATSDGRAIRGNRIRLIDDDGNDVGPGVPGEIVTVGAEQFVGYLDPGHDRGAFTDDGWFRTGDIGIVDEDGFLAIVDRKKDVIIRGGENIASIEVEQALASHPAVAEVAAVACPHERLGECVGVFVRLKDGMRLGMEDVVQHFAMAGISRQKTPERLYMVNEFPRTPLGKIKKAELRKQIPQREENL